MGGLGSFLSSPNAHTRVGRGSAWPVFVLAEGGTPDQIIFLVRRCSFTRARLDWSRLLLMGRSERAWNNHHNMCSSKCAVGSNLAHPVEGRTSKLGRIIETDLQTLRLAIAPGKRARPG